MNTAKLTRSALATVMLSMAAVGTAHAQQAFEDKYVPAPAPSPTVLVPLPTIGIVPVATVPLELDVAAQLSEAIRRELETTQETRFEVITRPNAGKTNWAFVVRNAPRAQHDAFTQQFSGQLFTCLHSLEDEGVEGEEVAALNVLLAGNQLDDQEERDLASAAGAQMLANWLADRCVTRRNDLPFFERNRARLTAATRGMLTDAFDPILFRGQGLLDLIVALTPVYLSPGGFWATEMQPRLRVLFEAGVEGGLLTTAETTPIAERELQTFWDWVILVVSTKSSIVRTFIEHTAAGCVRTVPELSLPFRLSRCVSEGKLRLVTLRVAGQNFTTVQRVQP